MRFRFTIRDLLWLAVVAALAVGWWLEHRQKHFVEVHAAAIQFGNTGNASAQQFLSNLQNCSACHSNH